MMLSQLQLLHTLTALFWAPELYLDPGSGSYLLQLLIAGVMGALLMLRVYWSRVKGFVLRLFGRPVTEDDE